MSKYHTSDISIIIIGICLWLLSGCSANNEKSSESEQSNGTFISEMNAALTEAVIIDLFSPPVASRIYVYPNIAAYEILQNSSVKFNTMKGILVGLDDLPLPSKDANIDLAVASLVAFVKVGKELVYTEAGLLKFESHKLDSLQSTGINEEVFSESIKFGNKVAEKILKWANDDSYVETRSAERYSLLNTDGSWLPTPPDYTPAMEPHWDQIRTFVIPNAAVYLPDSLIEFSTDPLSEFYSLNKEVYEAVNIAESDQIVMAKFWDDNPVVTEHKGHMKIKNKKMTPGGHWVAITSYAVRDYNLDMPSAAYSFAMTSIALADAFISCWDAKYHFQTIRPVTYINDHISSDWQPILQTPPFPEYPSGHSAISASAATVLTHMFGDNFAFVDSSETPFDLPVRSFNSFNHAAEEVALSRYYGGIHYKISNQVGVDMGVKVGNEVIKKLTVVTFTR